MKFIKTLFISLIRIYQKIISPIKIRPCCIFYPTCSQYAVEAIDEHGVIIGLSLGMLRILRCNPFNKHGGFDPVPKKKTK
ncbi:MAG: membrane protein insertion efficiency factor YidD [Eubacteriales bacterium]|jgi:putative membrane protein insertion efficiency factor|nr:membrane protein insertion efficiency factor YidD [Eubacteriales bacterium]